MQHLGEIDHELDDHQSAYRRFEESLAIARPNNYVELEGDCERMLGEVALEKGDVLNARHDSRAPLEVCSGAGDKRGEATRWVPG